MKLCHHLLLPLLTGLLAAAPARAVRDPFWPIGYVPVSERKVESPPKQEIAHAPEPPKPEPPKPEPTASEDDWGKARKALTISGFTRALNPDTHEDRTLVMINRQMLAEGDTVPFVYQGFRFKWRIASITDKDVKLEPLSAERVVQKAPALKQ